MPWWLWTIIGVYLLGFVATLIFHMMFVQMVMFPLAVIRALMWPFFWACGWPHGSPLPMD